MKVLVCDLNNIAMRCASVYVEAETPDGFPTGAMYGSVKMIRDFIADQPHDAVIGAIDWGHPDFRRQVCPEYKGQRDKKRDPKQERIYQRCKEQIPFLWEMLVPAGMATARAKNWEGDDVIASLCLHRLVDHECTILSSDRDFLGIIDGKRVKFYDVHNKMYREPDSFVTLKRCIDPKESDNLDGVPGIGPKTADKLIEKWAMDDSCPPPEDQSDQPEAFIAWCKTRPEKTHTGAATPEAKCVVEQQKIRANWKCTYLRPHVEAVNAVMKFRRPAFDKAAFKAAINKYHLTPMVEDFSALWPVFSRLQPAV